VLSLIYNGNRPFFLVVMRPGREFSHLPPSNFVVKKQWSYTFTPTICFMERIITFYPYLVVHRFPQERPVYFVPFKNLAVLSMLIIKFTTDLKCIYREHRVVFSKWKKTISGFRRTKQCIF
jgi:hypothetical protein